MSRIPTPASIEAAPSRSQPMLEAVKKQLGVAPNLFRLVSNSPAALEGYLGLSASLGKGELPGPTAKGLRLRSPRSTDAITACRRTPTSPRTSPS
jgi:hypothetical protein